MNVVMYALLSLCTGHACADYPQLMNPPSGLLLFTSLEDCEAKKATFGKLRVSGALTIQNKDGTVTKRHDIKFEEHCATIYFADYGQAERLLYGKVTCSYTTTLPESVMARSLFPYDERQHCPPAKQK